MIWRVLDILALAALAGGMGLIFQPWWAGGLRAGFFVVAAATVLHIVTTHVRKPDPS